MLQSLSSKSVRSETTVFSAFTSTCRVTHRKNCILIVKSLPRCQETIYEKIFRAQPFHQFIIMGLSYQKPVPDVSQKKKPIMVFLDGFRSAG